MSHKYCSWNLLCSRKFLIVVFNGMTWMAGDVSKQFYGFSGTFPSFGRLCLLLGEDANLMVCKIRLKFYILHYKTLNNRLEPPPWPLHILHVLVKVRLDQGSTGISLMYGIGSPSEYWCAPPNTHRYLSNPTLKRLCNIVTGSVPCMFFFGGGIGDSESKACQ